MLPGLLPPSPPSPRLPASLRRALLLSLTGHALLLGLGQWQPAMLPAPATVVQVALGGVRPGAVDKSVRNAVDSTMESGRKAEPARSAVPVMPREVVQLPASASSTAMPLRAMTAPADSARSSGSASVGSALASAAAAAGAVGGSVGGTPGAVAGAQEGVPPEVLAQYRYALAQEVRRLKVYPLLAREREWEGRVELRLQWLPGGVPQVVLGQGSGYRLLDEQAQLTLERAVRQVPVPEGLRGRGTQLDMSILYELRDGR